MLLCRMLFNQGGVLLLAAFSVLGEFSLVHWLSLVFFVELKILVVFCIIRSAAMDILILFFVSFSIVSLVLCFIENFSCALHHWWIWCWLDIYYFCSLCFSIVAGGVCIYIFRKSCFVGWFCYHVLFVTFCVLCFMHLYSHFLVS